MDINKIIAEPHPELRPEALKDGENIIHLDGGGRKLVAHVAKGLIVGWTAFDAGGTEVPSVVISIPGNDYPAVPLHPPKLKSHIVCIFEPPSEEHCWEVLVPD